MRNPHLVSGNRYQRIEPLRLTICLGIMGILQDSFSPRASPDRRSPESRIRCLDIPAPAEDPMRLEEPMLSVGTS